MWKDLDIRISRRQRRYRSYGQTIRCPSCYRFKASTMARCSCGYDAQIGWTA